MNEELYEFYAKEILDGSIDPFETDFEEFAKKFKKQELIGFEEVGDDVMKVQHYLLAEDEEFLLEDLRGAWQAQHYIDIAESMLFEDLDDLKLEYAQKILSSEIDPKQVNFKDFVKV